MADPAEGWLLKTEAKHGITKEDALAAQHDHVTGECSDQCIDLGGSAHY